MNKLIVGIGAAVGVAAAACITYRLKKQGKLDGICDDLHSFTNKTKLNIKNAIDKSRNHAEYIRDEIEYQFTNGKEDK
ncbi:MAG: hypothetical protein E6767_14440 [Dysgonomonas sp.]|nr:hypothetical protein [Dysgonomonas sp.]